MTTIISDIFSKLMLELIDLVNSSVLPHLFDIAFFAERQLDNTLKVGTFENLYRLMYMVSIGVLIARFLTKGFMIYILGRSGDATNSPLDLIKGFAFAIITAVGFPFIYEFCIDIVLWVTSQINTLLGLSVEFVNIPEPFGFLNRLSLILFAILYLVVLIYFFILFLQNGIELLILRIGVPLASIGLINTDGGMWTSYLQTLIKFVLTLALQGVLVNVSMVFFASVSFYGLCFALAVLMVAIKTPKLLQNFIIPSAGGGGFSQNIYQTARTFNMVKGLMKGK